MKKKFFLVLSLTFLLLAAIALVLVFNINTSTADVAGINDVLFTAEDNINGDLNSAFSNKTFNFKFALLDNGGKVLYENSKNAKTRKYDAIKSGGSAISFKGGTLIVTGSFYEKEQSIKKTALIIIFAFLFLCVFLSSLLYFYINRKFLRPFSKMSSLAKNISEGNFDIPLNMDKGNIFGAFTESFDLLRSQLKIARENERAASESKKQLVASLSHDIKTPLSSIKALAELLSVQIKDEKQLEKLEIINKKTEQISLLTNNLFHATLEELHELKVNPQDEESTVLKELLHIADYKNLLNNFDINGAIIVCDKLRTQQVFDNIIGNSYKYADTAIDVSSVIEDGFLKVTINDCGGGAPAEELDLIKQKFYRGSNAKEKDGSGIGLYMCDFFLKKMGGHFEVANKNGGFANEIYFKLS